MSPLYPPSVSAAPPLRPPISLSSAARIILAVLLAGGLLGLAFTVSGLLADIAYSPSPFLCVFQTRLTSRQSGDFSVGQFQKLRRSLAGQATLAAYGDLPLHLASAGDRIDVTARAVTSGFQSVTGSTSLRGRDLACDRSTAAGCREALLTEKTWNRLFASTAPGAEASVQLEGIPFRVVGVLASSQPGPSPAPDLYISYRDEPALVGMNCLTQDSPVRWLRVLVSAPNRVAQERANALLSRYFLLTPAQAGLVAKLRIRGPIVAAAGSHTALLEWLVLLSVLVVAATLLTGGAFSSIRLAPAASAVLAVLLVACATNLVLAAALPHFLREMQDRTAVLSLRASKTVVLESGLVLVAFFLVGRLLANRRVRRRPGTQNAFLNSGAFRWARKHRYTLLAGFLFAAVAGYWANGLFVSDFWEHAAVVRELAAHPLHPAHPIFDVSTPHPFFSPYGLALGLLSRLTGLSAVNSLAVASLANVLLLVCSLRLFVRRMLPAPGTDFYALLCLLALWGFFPIMMSGFLHLGLAIETASYPSFFALGFTLLVWYWYSLFLAHGSPWLFALAAACASLVLLVHPITGVALLAGLFALTLDRRATIRSMSLLALLGVLAFGLSFAWPYYSFRQMLLGSSHAFDLANRGVYPGLARSLQMTCFALLGVPALVGRFRAKRRDFLVVLALCLSAAYALGWLTGKFTLGRVASVLLLCFQLAFAAWLAKHPWPSFATARRSRTFGRTVAAHAVLGLAVLSVLPGALPAIPVFQNSYGEFEFLRSAVGQGQTVLADIHSSLKVPVFGGKVVGYPPEHAQMFLDATRRYSDAARFFAPETGGRDRLAILARYRPDYVLFSEQWTPAWPAVVRSLQDSATVQYADGDLVLLKLADLPPVERPSPQL